MADEMDLAALAAGEKDLVQGDFRQANLVGEDLSNRDFTRAQFDKGNLQRSNLSKSVLSEASFTQADLSHANLEGCTGRSNWVHTKLTSANLRNVKFAQSNFHTCDFRDADIRGADFSKANLIHDNDFNGVIANDATKFDGARILRPMARLSIFANYRLERGELKRIAGNEIPPVDEIEERRGDLQAALTEIESTLRNLVVQNDVQPEHGGIGHNNPPPEDRLGADEIEDGEQALATIRGEVLADNPDKHRVVDASKVLSKIAGKAADLASRNFGVFTEEFSKQAGKSLASPAGITALYLLFSGQWANLLNLLVKFFG